MFALLSKFILIALAVLSVIFTKSSVLWLVLSLFNTLAMALFTWAKRLSVAIVETISFGIYEVFL